MATEQQKADLSKKRGQAASYIQDNDKKKAFIAAQGELEGKKGGASDADYEKLSREAEDTIATNGQNKEVNLPSYKDGIDRVPKTGPAQLHEGEKVLNKADADEYREAKGELVDADDVPAKEVSEMHIKKVKGGHIITHKHSHPQHHKDETHVVSSMDQMHGHIEDHFGSPNDGEADADAGRHGIPETGTEAMAKDVGF